jgi:hypothetical protein
MKKGFGLFVDYRNKNEFYVFELSLLTALELKVTLSIIFNAKQC